MPYPKTKIKAIGYTIHKFDEELGIAYGCFMEPLVADHEKDVFSREDVAFVAIDFMENLIQGKQFDEGHDKEEHDAAIVECLLTERPDQDYHGKVYPVEGTWVGAIKFNEPDIREKIKDGTYAGFSVEIVVSEIPGAPR